MTPNAVGLPLVGGIPNAYEISLLSGDTENYRLNFRLSGPGGSFTVGASVMVFDDVTLTHMGKTSVNDMYFFGLDVGSHNAAGWLAVDWGTAGSAYFFVEADRMYTTATIYTLSVGFDYLNDGHGYLDHIIQATQVEFSSSGSGPPIPEPSAAVVFGVGMLIAGRRVIQRSR